MDDADIVALVTAEELALLEAHVSREAVARRAYELYLARGREPGRDVEDWLRAERELRG
jgi:hypothetical protein